MINEERLNHVSEILAQAMYHGLEAEVVLTALELVKSNPEMDELLALQLAAADWDVIPPELQHD